MLTQVEKITELPHAPTILYVTHHAEEITDKMSHILLLRRGKIVAQGPIKDIITPQVLENFMKVPSISFPLMINVSLSNRKYEQKESGQNFNF